MKTFDAKDSAETVVLTFDFTAGLAAGETLTGAIIVTVVMKDGVDTTMSTLLSGAAQYDVTNKMVLQAVQGGKAGRTYIIKVVVPTTNVNKVLALSGILSVAEQ